MLTIAYRHGISAHSYADDTQIYQHTTANVCVANVPNIISCIGQIKRWMTSNRRLKLNADKTDFILLGTRQQLEKLNLTSVDLDSVKVTMSNKVTCISVTVDRELTFVAHIKYLAGRCFYQLRQHRTVRSLLSVEAARTPVHAFVISHVDYCNSVFSFTCATHL